MVDEMMIRTDASSSCDDKLEIDDPSMPATIIKGIMETHEEKIKLKNKSQEWRQMKAKSYGIYLMNPN